MSSIYLEYLPWLNCQQGLVNDRPLIPLSDNPRDYTSISPSSLLTPLNDPHTPLGQPHNEDHLRCDYT